MMDYSEFVHECVDESGKTRYVVARYIGGWYVAPLSPWGRWLTDADWLAGRRAVDVAGAKTYTYACRQDAIRAARDLYGDDLVLTDCYLRAFEAVLTKCPTE